jgi:hypothetical protein
MARQQSNLDLAGSLAATLTPRAPPATAQPFRASQNSGLFDVGALYAQAFQQVASRTRSDPRLKMPLVRAAQAAWPVVAQPAWPVAQHWPQPELSYALEGEEPIEVAEIAHRSRGLGWFGVAVAWLATVTTSALIATTLPAHAPTHVRALPVAAVAAPSPPANAPTVATPPIVAPAPLPAIPTVPLSAIPVAMVQAAPAPAAAAPASPAHVAPKKVSPRGAAATTAHAHPAAPSAALAAPAVPAPPRASAPSKPAPASTAGMSLDDLIRREVQAESGKHH